MRNVIRSGILSTSLLAALLISPGQAPAQFGNAVSVVSVAKDERSEIRDRCLARPGFRGACHRARIRATRWLIRATKLAVLQTQRRTH